MVNILPCPYPSLQICLVSISHRRKLFWSSMHWHGMVMYSLPCWRFFENCATLAGTGEWDVLALLEQGKNSFTWIWVPPLLSFSVVRLWMHLDLPHGGRRYLEIKPQRHDYLVSFKSILFSDSSDGEFSQWPGKNWWCMGKSSQLFHVIRETHSKIMFLGISGVSSSFVVWRLFIITSQVVDSSMA